MSDTAIDMLVLVMLGLFALFMLAAFIKESVEHRSYMRLLHREIRQLQEKSDE